jgi:hypothetical protein
MTEVTVIVIVVVVGVLVGAVVGLADALGWNHVEGGRR